MEFAGGPAETLVHGGGILKLQIRWNEIRLQKKDCRSAPLDELLFFNLTISALRRSENE